MFQPMTQQDITKGFLQNDKEVILYYYKKLFKQIKKIIVTNGGDEDDVRNIIWKAFHAFKVQCQKKTAPPNNIEAYIVQIARFLWYKELKKKKQKANIHQFYNNLNEDTQLIQSVEDALITTDRYDIAKEFQTHLNNISSVCKQIIQLRYQHELPHEDIAARFNISVAASRKRLSRCLKDLALFIDSKGLTDNIANHYPKVIAFIKKHL